MRVCKGINSIEQEEKNNGESIIDISFYSIFLIYLIC